MQEQINIYLGFWNKYRLPILQGMKSAGELMVEQEYPLYAHEFKALGNRVSAGYSFNLEIKNGKVANNIHGSAVARDLFEMLHQSEAAKRLMMNHHYVLKMGKDFKLRITCLAKEEITITTP